MILLSTFFTFTETDVASLISYVKDLITDFTPLLIPIIAVSLGLIIIYGIVSAIRG